MNIDYAAIGRRIKNLRCQRGLTQERLAEMSGYSTAHIGKIEIGSSQPSLESLIDIANALNTSVDPLLADNVAASAVILKKDIEELLDGVTSQELTVMLSTLTTLRHTLVASRVLRSEQ